MYIRNSERKDIEIIMSIYDNARKFMRQNNNLHQWTDGFPQQHIIEEDIKKRQSYVVIDSNDEIVCVFAFLEGPDITYSKIYDGEWPNNNDYHVIHRIAVREHKKGIASFVYDECLKKSPIIRIDTHRDNIPMQQSLKKNGFTYCGIIHLLNGDERLAYQKERI